MAHRYISGCAIAVAGEQLAVDDVVLFRLAEELAEGCQCLKVAPFPMKVAGFAVELHQRLALEVWINRERFARELGNAVKDLAAVEQISAACKSSQSCQAQAQLIIVATAILRLLQRFKLYIGAAERSETLHLFLCRTADVQWRWDLHAHVCLIQQQRWPLTDPTV